MDETKLYWVIILLLLVIIALLGVGILYAMRQKQNLMSKNATEDPEETQKPAIEEQYEVQHCENHPNIRASSTCAICSKPLCTDCTKSSHKLTFCQEHLHMFHTHEWVEVHTISSNADEPESAIHLYQAKEYFWKNEKKPSFIKTRYKIDIDNDRIESHVSLHTIEELKPEFNQKLQAN